MSYHSNLYHDYTFKPKRGKETITAAKTIEAACKLNYRALNSLQENALKYYHEAYTEETIKDYFKRLLDNPQYNINSTLVLKAEEYMLKLFHNRRKEKQATDPDIKKLYKSMQNSNSNYLDAYVRKPLKNFIKNSSAKSRFYFDVYHFIDAFCKKPQHKVNKIYCVLTWMDEGTPPKGYGFVKLKRCFPEIDERKPHVIVETKSDNIRVSKARDEESAKGKKHVSFRTVQIPRKPSNKGIIR